jgi:hypothetical protein
MNAHDLDALLGCFDRDYERVHHLNPDRGFRGRKTVRVRWAAIFGAISDFHAELLRSAAAGDEEWGEWRWQGTRADGSTLDVRGVTIVGVCESRIVWGRFYLDDAGEAMEECALSPRESAARSSSTGRLLEAGAPVAAVQLQIELLV